MGQKTVTLGEAAEAIIKNGLPKHKGWEKRDGGKVVAACAIAQGARNLGVTHESLNRALKEVYVFNGGQKEETLSAFIIHTNDGTETPVEAIGLEVKRRVGALWDMPLTVSTTN